MASTSSSRKVILHILVAMALCHTLLLTGVTIIGYQTYSEAKSKATVAAPFLALIDSSTTTLPAEVRQEMHSLLNAVVFGSPNGTIAGFLQNTFGTDFAGIAMSVGSMMKKLEQSANNLPRIEPVYAMCEPHNDGNDYAICFGQQVWCYPPLQLTQCNYPLQPKDVLGTIASATRMMTDKIQDLRPLDNSTQASDPAFSTGLFRVNVLFDWIKRNADDIDAWHRGGEVCSSFLAQLRNVEWAGTYLNRQQFPQTYNVTKQVNEVMHTIQLFCDGFKAINQY